jgi:hypothetical protein
MRGPCPLWVNRNRAIPRPCRPMSALSPLATIRGVGLKCRDVPIATDAPQQIGLLFDHLVGAGEQRRRHGEAERLGGLQVDDRLVLGRRLHRHVGGLGAAQHLDDKTRPPLLQVNGLIMPGRVEL